MTRPSLTVTGTNNSSYQASVNWANGVAEALYSAPLNVKEFGALGNSNDAGTTGADDTAAIQAAIEAAVTAGGGVVYFPPGDYKCAGSLDLASHGNIVFMGPSGSGAGYSLPPPAQLIHTGTGARFIDARSTYGCAFRDLGIRYTSSSFAGELLDASQISNDTHYLLVERCLLYGKDVTSARSIINLEKAILCSVVDSHIGWGQVGIRGRYESSPGNYGYSNAHSFKQVTFDNLTVAAALNAGQGWTFDTCWFEGTNGGSGGMPYAYLDNLSSGAITQGLTFIGCWAGDDVNVDTAWINTGTTQVLGLAIIGGTWLNEYASVPFLKLGQTCEGVTVTGTHATRWVDLGNVQHLGVSITGNRFGQDVAGLTANSHDVLIAANRVFGGYAKTYIRVSNPQEVHLGDPTGGSSGVNSDVSGVASIGLRSASKVIRFGQDQIGFFGAVPGAKAQVTGARGGNAALASLLTALHNYGLIDNASTA